MDANAPGRRGRGPRWSAAAVASIVTVLVAIVVVASSGSAPRGSIAQRRPSEGLIDTVVSLVLVVMVLSTVAAAVLLSFFGRYTPDLRGRVRSKPKQTALTLLVIGVVLALAVSAVARRDGELRIFGGPPPPAATGGATPDPNRYEPEFAVWPVVAVVGLGIVACLAWWLSARGRRSALDEPPANPAEALADVLAATLDDLRTEHDPRRAVIGAYARMERSLAAVGLPRASAEAPEEYLDRVLEAAAVSRRAAGRLTALFERARFSEHEIGRETKSEAIAALEEVLDELAADEAEREARLAGALT